MDRARLKARDTPAGLRWIKPGPDGALAYSAAASKPDEGPGMSGGNWKELFNAGCEGDLALVEYHVKCGVDLNYAHPEFLTTPLVGAILAGQEEVALFLLAQGALPDLPSELDGLTPIQAARRAGLARVEDRLVERGVERPPAEAVRPAGWFRRLRRRLSRSPAPAPAAGASRSTT